MSQVTPLPEPQEPEASKDTAAKSAGITLSVFGRTDVGLIREHNEDNFLIANIDADFRTHDMEAPHVFSLGSKGAVFLVCDGMGGAVTAGAA